MAHSYFRAPSCGLPFPEAGRDPGGADLTEAAEGPHVQGAGAWLVGSNQAQWPKKAAWVSHVLRELGLKTAPEGRPWKGFHDGQRRGEDHAASPGGGLTGRGSHAYDSEMPIQSSQPRDRKSVV